MTIENGIYEYQKTGNQYRVIRIWRIKLFFRWWEFVVYQPYGFSFENTNISYIRSARAFSRKFEKIG